MLFLRTLVFQVTHTIPVGAELARDGGVSDDIYAECQTVIASKLGSYRFFVVN